MTDTPAPPTEKPWWRSRTILGALVALASVVFGFFNVKIDPASQAVLLDQVEALVTAAGTLVGIGAAIWGRFVAVKQIAR
jgi:flagellar motor component MotA